jgi:crotonobetainyl-CoA:carnitine CoA-transferase CaiB-like acyl-CoA transferase
MLGIQNEREWASFCTGVLENPSLASDARFTNNSLRSANRADLKKEICDYFAGLTAAQVVERLDRAAIANASVNDMKDLWEHPQLKARRRWTEVDTPAGRIPALLPPGTGGDGLNARMDPVPKVGEHNESILAELGM